jgi:hypothetical protein
LRPLTLAPRGAASSKVPIKALQRMAKQQVLKEREAFSLRHVGTLNNLPWQHVIMLEKKAAEKKDDTGK